MGPVGVEVVGVCGEGGGGVATRVSSRCDADALPCSFSTLDGPRCSACPPVRRPPDPYPLLFVAAADGAGRADMREDPLVRWVCSGVVRCRTSGSQDGRYLRAMPICASGLVCSRCRRRCRDSRESRPGARRVSLPPRASAQLNAGVETATVDGMGCDGDGRETGFDGSTNSQVSTWRVPFQRRELDGGRQGVGTEFRGLWRVRGRRGQGECPGSGHCSRSMHWCTTASRLVSCAQLGKASRTTDGRRPPIGPRHRCIFGLPCSKKTTSPFASLQRQIGNLDPNLDCPQLPLPGKYHG